MSTIGSRIRKRREELGLSQDELSKRLGYKSRSSINKIELDQRNLTQSKIKAIADALDTTPAYIMGWKERAQRMFDSTRKVATVGERLSEALTKKGMRQAELCRRTGVHSSSMSLYLSGAYEPKQDKIYKMSKALNVSSEWLMGYDVQMMRFPWEEMSPGETQLTEG